MITVLTIMTYTVGIIGTGFGAKVHLPGFQEHENFNVEIIAGRSEEKTMEIAKNSGIKGTTDWTQVIKSNVDVVAITTPPFLHYKMAKEVISAGKHLLLEKPTTHNQLQAKELASMAINKGLVGMMSHEFRWLPHRRFLTHLIQSGKIGQLREIHYHNFYQFAATQQKPPFGWLWDSRFEGGMLGALGSHLIDQVRDTTNKEFQSISGYITTRVKQRPKGKDLVKVTADDGFGFHFTMDDDVIGNLTATTTISPAPTSQFVLGGDEGTLNLKDNELFFAEIEGDFEKVGIPDQYQLDTRLEDKDRRLPPFMKLLDQFHQALDEGVAKTPSLTDGWRNQQVIDAIKESHRIGSEIRINQ